MRGLEEAYDVRTSLNTLSYLFAGVVGDVGRVVIITFGGMDWLHHEWAVQNEVVSSCLKAIWLVPPPIMRSHFRTQGNCSVSSPPPLCSRLIAPYLWRTRENCRRCTSQVPSFSSYKSIKQLLPECDHFMML